MSDGPVAPEPSESTPATQLRGLAYMFRRGMYVPEDAGWVAATLERCADAMQAILERPPEKGPTAWEALGPQALMRLSPSPEDIRRHWKQAAEAAPREKRQMFLDLVRAGRPVGLAQVNSGLSYEAALGVLGDNVEVVDGHKRLRETLR